MIKEGRGNPALFLWRLCSLQTIGPSEISALIPLDKLLLKRVEFGLTPNLYLKLLRTNLGHGT